MEAYYIYWLQIHHSPLCKFGITVDFDRRAPEILHWARVYWGKPTLKLSTLDLMKVSGVETARDSERMLRHMFWNKRVHSLNDWFNLDMIDHRIAEGVFAAWHHYKAFLYVPSDDEIEQPKSPHYLNW